MEQEKTVIEHYSRESLRDTVMSALQAAGRDTGRLTIDDLAPFDEFHIGGRAATAHLMAYLQFQPGQHILDIGSGLGGPARYLVSTRKTYVTGIDLIPEYCSTAALLTEKTGLGDFIAYRQGNALDMIFSGEEFDGAYSIHAIMNIADKASLYRKIFWALRPGGFFGFYDILAGDDTSPFAYPVPWAAGPEGSFLATPERTRTLLTEAGFSIVAEDDLRGFALLALKKLRAADSGPCGPQLIMGDDYKTKIGNLIENIEKNRCAPRVIICKKERVQEND